MIDTEKLELQGAIENLEKENKLLQEEINKDVIVHSDLLMKNQDLEQQNRELLEENEKLKKEIKDTEKVVLEIADKLYKDKFNVLKESEIINELSE